MSYLPGAPTRRALVLALVASPTPALAASADIVVIGRHMSPIENAPSTAASIDAERIDATVNAVNVEDTLKYLPSLLVRKRHIGDTQAPLATRTSGVGASARSLIYADGALLSALIGNNNTIASPRWGMVSPEEVARIDVLYGPFSAAYPGNSIGAVVNITTRLPDTLEGSATAGINLQRFSQYGTSRTLPAPYFGATLGDRFGPLAIFASASHVASKSQPLAYVTALRATGSSAPRVPVTGAYPDRNREGAPIAVLGASGFEHQRQDNFKLKAALDIAPDIRLTYVGGLFLNDTDASAETYLSDATGQPVYAGNLDIGGLPYAVPASAFSNNVYRYDERHLAHSLSATGQSRSFDWQLIGTLYDFDRDTQRVPAGALPAASRGGAGNITRLDGTGWFTFDAKGVWRADAAATHALSFGIHRDRFRLNSNRFATSDWIDGAPGALNLASRGRTRTDALWAQDAWRIAPPLTLTIGGRYERWKAYDGFNFAIPSSGPAAVDQPKLRATRFSPKASLAWVPAGGWKATLSWGEAYRFPTVSELYQVVTTGPTVTVPNPDLKPERARSTELALQRDDDRGSVRLSLFAERIDDALLSQTAPLVPNSPTLYSYVQNVDRVRARGVELAFEQRDLLVEGFDLAGSVTLVDARIKADAAFPAAIGKRPPQIARRRATLVASWRPNAALTLTAAARYSSRSFATINNVDTISNTYQGFAKYFVVDLRARLKASPHWSLAVGVDNVNNDKYFLFHPFPQRSFVAELMYRL